MCETLRTDNFRWLKKAELIEALRYSRRKFGVTDADAGGRRAPDTMRRTPSLVKIAKDEDTQQSETFAQDVLAGVKKIGDAVGADGGAATDKEVQAAIKMACNLIHERRADLKQTRRTCVKEIGR